MSELRKRYDDLRGQQLDISEHLGLLYGLACSPCVLTIGEIGFRTGVSTTALALSRKPTFSIDIKLDRKMTKWFVRHAPNVMLFEADSMKTEVNKCDLLHIDGEHTYRQVRAELKRWAPSVGKWIALHDTETFGAKGRDNKRPGLTQAIDEFIEENSEWRIQLHLTNNNGFTLLERSTTPSAATATTDIPSSSTETG